MGSWAILLLIASASTPSVPQNFQVGSPSPLEEHSVRPEVATDPPSVGNSTSAGAILARASSTLSRKLPRRFQSFLSMYLDYISFNRPKDGLKDSAVIDVTSIQTDVIYASVVPRTRHGCGLGYGFPRSIRLPRQKLAKTETAFPRL